MMLTALTFVVFVWGTWALDPKLVAKNFTQSLESRTKLDWSISPQYEKSKIESTCAGHFFSCWNTEFLLRQTVLKPGHNITIDYDTIPQRRFLNLNNEPVTLDTDDSIWTTQADTQGWNVGAQYSTKGVTVSAGWSQSTFKSKIKIKSLRIFESCPPGHECRFETWVYHANLDGQCQRKAFIKCAAEYHDICPMVPKYIPNEYLPTREGMRFQISTTPGPFLCEQWNSWTQRQCWDPKGPQYASRPQADCAFRIPILELRGEPLWTLVFIKEDHSGNPTGAATKAYPNCVFKLDTGEYYDLISDTYAKSATFTDGFSRPDDPAPYIPDDFLPSDCRLSKYDAARKDEGNGQSRDPNTRGHVAEVIGLTKRGAAEIEVKVVAGFEGF